MVRDGRGLRAGTVEGVCPKEVRLQWLLKDTCDIDELQDRRACGTRNCTETGSEAELPSGVHFMPPHTQRTEAIV